MIKIVNTSSTEPVSFEEAVMHLRLTPVANDDSPAELVYPEEALVRLQITAAREYCEQSLERALVPKTVEYALAEFPSGVIELPYSPVARIISIKYSDGDGVEQTMDSANYQLNDFVSPNQVALTFGQEWPTTQSGATAVRIRYETGFSSGDDSPSLVPVPTAIKQAMLLLIGHWFENREVVNIGNITSTLDFTVASLLKPYQLRMSMA